jgi:hypothetical protein
MLERIILKNIVNNEINRERIIIHYGRHLTIKAFCQANLINYIILTKKQ